MMSQRAIRAVVLAVAGFVFLSLGSALVAGDALATDAPAPSASDDSGEDRQLAEGRVVFEANCAICHQTDGKGISGVFPPLVDNPNVVDAAYVRQVVAEGRTGEVVVNGATYNGAMPAFAALSDEQVEVLTLYVLEGLGAPAPVAPSQPATSPSGGKGLPGSTVLAYTAAFGIFAVGFAAVAGPVALAQRLGGQFSSVQVWLKALLIFAYFVLATVFLPSMLVEASFLASPPSVYEDIFSGKSWGLIRDLIGTGVWLGALLFGFWALRRAQRQDVI